MVSIERAKKHFSDNKQLYIGLGIGVSVGLIFAQGDRINTGIQGLLIWKPINVTETVLIRRGHPGIVVRHNESGEVFASINRAAEVLGVRPARISEHLKGKLDTVSGNTFTSLGEAA